MHRLRVWLRSPSPFTIEEELHPSSTYQRIWSTDEFGVEGYLNFMNIDPKRVTIATPVERPPLRIYTTESHRPGRVEQ